MYKNVFLQNLQCQLMHGITVQVFGQLSVCTQSYLLCHNAGWSQPLSAKLAYLDPTPRKSSLVPVSVQNSVWDQSDQRCRSDALDSLLDPLESRGAASSGSAGLADGNRFPLSQKENSFHQAPKSP